MRPRKLERDVRRVDGVVLAVVELRFEVDERIPGERPCLHGLPDPLVDRRDEVVRDRAADDRVFVLVTFAALPRRQLNRASRELSAASRLLLQLAVGLGR